MKKLLLIGTVVLLMATPASAQTPSSPFFGSGTNSYGTGGSYGDASGCDALCQSKCQRAWRALGFRSVNACVARWAKLNAEGTAATCETAIKANGMRPIRGC